MESCIYSGWVRHRRRVRPEREFRYPIFFPYLDLEELPDLLDRSWGLIGRRRWAFARFRREDHLGDPRRPLEDCVRELVEGETGCTPQGPIRLLTQLRYFGFTMNPVSFYFCFDRAGAALHHVVAEVHNTPWNERHCYVLPAARPTEQAFPEARAQRVPKRFHVSPFLPMAMSYRWRFRPPGRRLAVHIENHAESGSDLPKVSRGTPFEATLSLARRPWSRAEWLTQLARQPVPSVLVATRIYWQAARLWLRRAHYYPHPGRTGAGTPPGASTELKPSKSVPTLP